MHRLPPVRDLLDRLNTAPLQQGDAPTRALVALNPSDAAITTALGVFPARFPVRREVGAQPVTVWDTQGNVLPCRVANERLKEDPAIAPRIWWTFDLLVVLRDIPAQGWRAVAATYGQPPPLPEEAAIWQAAEASGERLPLEETDCHAGDLPATGSLFDAPERDAV